MSFELEHQAFSKATSDVRTAAGTLRHEMGAIDKQVTGFLNAGWTGVAAEAFTSAWGDWEKGAGDVLEGLVAMAELLDAAHTDFTVSDEGSQQRLDAVAARIIERLG